MSTFDLLSNNATLVSGSLTEITFCLLIGFTNIENVACFFLIQIWYKSSNFKGVYVRNLSTVMIVLRLVSTVACVFGLSIIDCPIDFL
jgi:hypothetical protein